MKAKDFIGVTVTVASILWLMFLALHLEGYVWFAPYISTRFSDDFSLEEYEKVQLGMNNAEVKALIGDPLSFMGHTGHRPYSSSHPAYGWPTCEYYTDDNAGIVAWDLAWVDIHICYDDEGKVDEISKHIS